MIKENNTIEIHQNQSIVFEFLTNDKNLSQWVNGIVAVRPIGTHKNQVGDAVFIDVNMPKKGTIKSTLTLWQAPTEFATEYKADSMFGKIKYQLEKIDSNHTKVIYSASHFPQKFLMKLCSPLIALVIKKERIKELQRLKDAIEQLRP